MKTIRASFLLLFLILETIACQKSSTPSATSRPFPVDGQIVFCGRRDGSDRFDIYLMNLDTREWANLTEDYIFQIDDTFGNSIGCDDNMHPYRVTGLAWSPNGDLLIVDAGGPYLSLPYVISLSENGEVQKIVQQWPRPWPNSHIFEDPQEFSWSPKGDKVAFSGLTGSDGYRNLFVGDVSNWMYSTPDTTVIQMTEEYRDWPGVIYYPSWSPNGEYIAVSLNGYASGVAIADVNNAEIFYTTNDTSKQLSYVQSPSSPWIDSKPSWFPDSESVVFVAATSPNDRTALFKVDKSGQNLQLIAPKNVWNPLVSNDGQFIAYIEYAEGFEVGTIGRIVRVDAEGNNRQVLATIKLKEGSVIGHKYYIRDLSISPDNKWLTFTSNASGKFQIYLVSTDGDTTALPIDFYGDAVYPQWRPTNRP